MDEISIIYMLILFTLISSTAKGFITESPQTFYLAAPAKGQLELIWHDNDNKYCGENLSYDVVYHEKRNIKTNKKFNQPCQNSTEKIIIYDLKPNKEYEVSVCFLVNNTSKFITASATTLPDIPNMLPEADGGFYFADRLNENLTIITIFWKDLSDDEKNGPEFKYVVKFMGEVKEFEHPPAVFSISNSFFNASITAKNYVGLSSNSVFISSEEESLEERLHKCIHLNISATYVIVNLNYSRCKLNLISKIDIKLCEIIDSTNCSELTSPPCDVTTSCEFEKLYPYTDYRFDVFILLQKRHKVNFSRIITTLQSKPDKPVQNLQAIFVNESMVMIKWDPPKKLPGKFQAYTIEYTDELMVIPHFNVIFTNEFSIDVVGYMSYNFIISVCLIDVYDCSPPANISVTTPIAAPSEVQSSMEIKILSVQKMNQVTLFWKPPKVPNGPLDHYRIEYFWNANGQSYHRKHLTKNRSINLTVECNALTTRNYSFKVSAVNIVNNTFLFRDFNKADIKYIELCEEVLYLQTYWIIIIIILSGLGLGLLLFISYTYLKKFCKFKSSLNVILPDDIEVNVYNFYSERMVQRNILSKCYLICCKLCKSTSKTDEITKGQASRAIKINETDDLKKIDSLAYVDVKQNGNFRLKLYSNDSGFDGSIYSNECSSPIYSVQPNECYINNNVKLKHMENSMKHTDEDQTIDKADILTESQHYSKMYNTNNVHQSQQLQRFNSMEIIRKNYVIQENYNKESNNQCENNKYSNAKLDIHLPKNLKTDPMNIIENECLYNSELMDKSQNSTAKSSPVDNVSMDFGYPYLENNTETLSGYIKIEDSLFKAENKITLSNSSDRISGILPDYSRIKNSSLQSELNFSLDDVHNRVTGICPGYSRVDGFALESELNYTTNNTHERITDILPEYCRVEGFLTEKGITSSISDLPNRIIEIFPDSTIEDHTVESESNFSINNQFEGLIDTSLDNNGTKGMSLELKMNSSLSNLPQTIRDISPCYTRVDSISSQLDLNNSINFPSENLRNISPGYSLIESPTLMSEVISSVNIQPERITELLPDNNSMVEGSLLESEENYLLSNPPETITEILPGYSRVDGLSWEPNLNYLLSHPAENLREISQGYSIIESPILVSEVTSSLSNPPQGITYLLPGNNRFEGPLVVNNLLSNPSERMTDILPGYSRVDIFSSESDIV